MPSKASVVWSIKEFVEILKERQLNKYDCNMGVSGKRGEGKSSIINKIFLRFKGFKPWKHQVYSREDVMDLLKNHEFGFCWDDEAINTGYKRDFQNKGQQELIKLITAYRDNFNIYASAIPFFYSLDKDLRELIFVHIHIIERGLAVIFMQLEDNIHQTDPWDTKNNSKKEEKWQKKKAEDPNFKFPYHKLSTFVGYLRFNDLTSKQRELYEEIKKEKRKSAFLTDDELQKQKEEDIKKRLYVLMIEGKLTEEGLKQTCLASNKNYSTMRAYLNRRITDAGDERTLRQYLDPSNKEIQIEKTNEQIVEIVPQI